MDTDFDEAEIEAFKEVGNVGAGHAAIALTKLFKREVDMSVPFVRIGSIEDIVKTIELGEDTLVGYEISEIEDPIRYRVAVLFKSDVIIRLIKLLSSTEKEVIEKEDDLTDMHKSLVQEIGSTIILRYIAALNKMMKVESMPSTAPVFQMDKAVEALTEIGYKDQKTILIQLDLFTDSFKFESNLFIQPHTSTKEEYRKAFFP